MPVRPKHPCNYQGCNQLTNNRYCEYHTKQTRQQHDRYRGSAAQRGYDTRWQKYREQYLRDHPLCVKCLKLNKLIESTVVDHIIPHKGDMVLFWDTKNHQALCKRCHDIKTATEDGGFGNKGRG